MNNIAYSIIPNRILKDNELSPQEKIFAGIILGEIVQKGEFSQSNREIARMMKTSEASIKNLLKRLYQKNIIKNNGNKRERTLILVCRLSEQNENPSQNLDLFSEGAKYQNDTSKYQIDTLEYQNDTSENNSPLLDTRGRAGVRKDTNTKDERYILDGGSRGKLLNFSENEKNENHYLEAFEEIYKSYPKKTTKQLALSKWKQKRLWLKAKKIMKAVENYKKTENVQKGYVLDFTKFLDRYEDYIDGIPEGVKAGKAIKTSATNASAKTLIDKLVGLRSICLSDLFMRERVFKTEASKLRAKSGAAFFTAAEARAVETLGGTESAIFAEADAISAALLSAAKDAR